MFVSGECGLDLADLHAHEVPSSGGRAAEQGQN